MEEAPANEVSVGAKTASKSLSENSERPDEATIDIPYHIEKLVDSKRSEVCLHVVLQIIV